MLKQFKLKNYKNFKNEIIFNLEKTGEYDFNEHLFSNEIITKALIYGPNASGKSNLAHALFDIIPLLVDDSKSLSTTYGNSQGITEFYYEFIFDGTSIEYTYHRDNKSEIIYEQLKQSKKIMFEIDYLNKKNKSINNINFAQSIDLSKTKKGMSMLRFIKNNTIYTNKTRIGKFFNFIDQMIYLKPIEGEQTVIGDLGVSESSEKFFDSIEIVKELESYLKRFGLDYDLNLKNDLGINKVTMKIDNNELDFLSTASTGTVSLVSLFHKLYNQKNKSLIFIDEFDAYYHHNLSKTLIKELVDHSFAQIIITTHSPFLMSNDYLRPDCYFILNNNKISSINNLTNKKLQQYQNLEKLFTTGFFDE